MLSTVGSRNKVEEEQKLNDGNYNDDEGVVTFQFDQLVCENLQDCKKLTMIKGTR